MPTSNGLTATLQSLINQSGADGCPHVITLTRGLTVEVDMQPTKFTLRTWRSGQLPDPVEWSTCFDYLPPPFRSASRPTPIEYIDEGRCLLSASWPVLRLL